MTDFGEMAETQLRYLRDEARRDGLKLLVPMTQHEADEMTEKRRPETPFEPRRAYYMPMCAAEVFGLRRFIENESPDMPGLDQSP